MEPRTKSIPTIPAKWVFGIKGNGQKKARLVVVGCRDTEIYSPNDKTSPTPSMDTTRWLLAHASHDKLNLVQIDVKCAFLQANIDRTKYIALPPGVKGNPKTQVARLNRALYGLAISPKCWYLRIDTFLTQHGFERSC